MMRFVGKEISGGLAIAPIDGGDATLTGVAIDRKNYENALFVLSQGLSTGTPTDIDITWKVQHSDASTSGFADVSGTLVDETGTTGFCTGTAVANATPESTSTATVLSVDLKPLKRYVKVVATLTHTGGSTPTTPVGATYALAQNKKQ
jgi:hypothetical protein